MISALRADHDGRQPHRMRTAALVLVLTFSLALGVTGTFIGGAFGTQLAGAQTVQTPTTQQPSSTNGSLAGVSVADVAAKVNPAVVTISNLQTVSQNGPFGSQGGNNGPFGNQGNNNGPFGNQGNQGTQNSQNGTLQVVGKGSGFIFDNDGHVLTNWHVIDGAQQIQVEFYNGTTVDATLVGSDEVQDVAVLKLQLKSGQKLPGVATLGNSSTVRPGDAVVAIGSALGQYTNSVTDGIVGGVNRTLDEGNGAVLANLIQHDAPLSSGNSGGPLINMQGQVVGMNVAAIPSGELASGNQANGLDFAIEINSVKSVAQQLIATGKVVRPYIGIELAADGQTIAQVDANTPASQAGLQAGDVITAVNGTQITDQMPLQTLLYQHKPGDTITLTVQHQDGSTSQVKVTLAQRPANSQ